MGVEGLKITVKLKGVVRVEDLDLLGKEKGIMKVSRLGVLTIEDQGLTWNPPGLWGRQIRIHYAV